MALRITPAHQAKMIITSNKICKTFNRSDTEESSLFKRVKEKKEAVKELSLEIEEGEFVGFLGPNGAGKTTFLKILSGIIYPTSGEAKVLGFTPWERDYDFLKSIAIVMGQKNQLWWDLPTMDSFVLLKEIYDIPEKKFKNNVDLMVETIGMKDLLYKRLRNMSLGERMKCELAASFLHDPKILFLDEPTIGLDVVSSRSIRNFLKKINKEKKNTIILTSHYMGDIEELCKRVIIIDKGMKVYDGLLKELKEKYAPDKEIRIELADLSEKQKFAKLKIKTKKIAESTGIISVDNKNIGEATKEVFETFDPQLVTIAEADTEKVIAHIFENKIT